MLARIGVIWRAFGTGFCFAGYGVGSLLASATVLPVLLLWPATPEIRRRRIRRFVSWTFRALLATIAGLRLGYVEVEGREWLAQAQGKLVVASHPMYLDVVALIALMPQADCVVKNALWRNPFTRGFVKAGGYINNADSEHLLENCIASVRGGQTLILFPQGTREVPGEPLCFKRGAAQVAIRGQCEILPVVIHCWPPALLKNTQFYEVADQPWRLRIKAFPPQPLAAFGHEQGLPPGVAARHLTHNLEHFFKQQLATYGHADRRTETAHHRLARS